MSKDLTPGQRRLLENLAGRGMPKLPDVCDLARVSSLEAFDLEEQGLVKIEDDESPDPDSEAVIFITEAGKRKIGR